MILQVSLKFCDVMLSRVYIFHTRLENIKKKKKIENKHGFTFFTYVITRHTCSFVLSGIITVIFLYLRRCKNFGGDSRFFRLYYILCILYFMQITLCLFFFLTRDIGGRYFNFRRLKEYIFLLYKNKNIIFYYKIIVE